MGTSHYRLAGVVVDGETMQHLVNTLYSPTMPIERVENREVVETIVPADDLRGYIADVIGLDRTALTEAQAAAIDAFVATNSPQG